MALWLLGVIACTSSDGGSKAASNDSPAQLSEIPVLVDGKPAPVVNQARVAGLEPTYKDGTKRAWALTALLGDAVGDERTLEIVGRNKVRILHSRPGVDRKGKPLALVVGVGEPFIGRVDPNKPFAEPTRRRVDRIVALKLYRRGKPKPATRTVDTAALKLTIEYASGKSTVWRYAEISKVPVLAQQKHHWSLRKIAAGVAAGARVTALETRKGTRIELSAEQWNDANKLPVVKLNRRGQLKFWWTTADKPRGGGKAVRDVTKLHVVLR